MHEVHGVVAVDAIAIDVGPDKGKSRVAVFIVGKRDVSTVFSGSTLAGTLAGTLRPQRAVRL